jgi:PAS domain S-box-containing protein
MTIVQQPQPPLANILIVDDTREDLRLLSKLLRTHGYAVRTQLEGRLAINSAQTDPPDLILLDVMMPGMDGYAVCTNLKADTRTSDIPIIFISASGDVVDKVKGFSLGGVDYITKPYQVEEVLARVATHLQLQRMQKQLQEQNTRLQQEVLRRQQVEQALRQAHDELEARVFERTRELSQTNQALQAEIEERKQAEHALRESEERYRTLVETSPNAILLTEIDSRIRFCNQQAVDLFRYDSIDDLQGQYSANLLPPDLFPLDQIRMIFETGNIRNLEYTLCRKDGSRFPAEVSSSVVCNPRNEPTALIIVVRDISENKKLQAQLIANERFAAGGRLAATVAHEINTPLQALQNFLDLISIATDADRQHFLQSALLEVQRVGRIVGQLLDLYRPSTTRPGPIHINTLIERILLLLGKRLKEQGITIEKHLGTDTQTIWGRADEMTQVLLNIMINAIDAMPYGGILTIRCHVITNTPSPNIIHEADQSLPDTRRFLHIAIQDTGPGISPDIQDYMFEPFVTIKEQGTGLGLNISNQIVSQYGGTIIVESQENVGSCFTIVFPLT